jgi:hypothetical protein
VGQGFSKMLSMMNADHLSKYETAGGNFNHHGSSDGIPANELSK